MYDDFKLNITLWSPGLYKNYFSVLRVRGEHNVGRGIAVHIAYN